MKTRYFQKCKELGWTCCGLIKDLKTRYFLVTMVIYELVVVWLKIWKHDIVSKWKVKRGVVVVWLKIWKHDIKKKLGLIVLPVVVWLKIWKHDIKKYYERQK